MDKPISPMTELDPCALPGLFPFEDALNELMRKVSPISDTLSLPLNQALGFTAAKDILSPINVPGFDNSAMDGYACQLRDLSDTRYLTQVGESFAGKPFNGNLASGECIRIMTGAKIPTGANCVVMQENTVRNGTQIKFNQIPDVGNNIRLEGSDIQRDQQIIGLGDRINTASLGLLSSLGMTHVTVYRKLKVAIFSTGDELVEPGELLGAGQIYDSNRIVTQSVLNKLNIEYRDFGIIEDSQDTIEQTLLEADNWADVVITSGGVSVGDADYLKPAINKIGKLELWRIAIKPGKPFAYGKLPNSHFIGLPGNPVSALVTLYQLAVPMLRRLQGTLPITPRRLLATTMQKLNKKQGRLDFQRGRLTQTDNDEWLVSTTGTQSSGVLSSMSLANCFIVLGAEQGNVEKGEQVTVELFNELLS